MNILSIIFFIIFTIAIIYLILTLTIGRKGTKKQMENYLNDLKERNVICEYMIIHLTGHPYLKTNATLKFQIKTNKTLYFFRENIDTGEEIPLAQIIRYEVKTETEIQKDVTLTRLVALGIFAFGAKKTTKIQEQFFILSYIQNEIEITCVFKQGYRNQNLHEIVSTLNRMRIENNKFISNQKEECIT